MQTEPAFDRQQIAQRVVNDYGLDIADLRFVPVGFSTACYASGQHFLKIWPPEANGGESAALLEVTLPLMEILAGLGLRSRIPAPIRTREGLLRSTYRDMPLAVFPLLEGVHAPESNADVSVSVWTEMACVMAEIHGATVALAHLPLARERFDTPVVATLRRALAAAAAGGLAARGLDRVIQPRRLELLKGIERFERVRAAAASSIGREVVCHRDFGGFNVLVGGDGRLAVLDWDWPAIAAPEHDLWFAAGPRLGQFLDAYWRAGGVGDVRREHFEFAILRRALEDLAVRVERLLDQEVSASQAEDLLDGIVRWGFGRIATLDEDLGGLSVASTKRKPVRNHALSPWAESTDAELVLAAVNRRRRTTWRLVEPLSHGVNQGAYRVVDASNRQAAFKVGRNAGPPGSRSKGPWGRGLRRVAPILRRARANGWPAPAFLAFGEVGGVSFVLQEWVDGQPVLRAGCDDATLTAILEIVEVQAGLAPAGTQDWSSYVRQVLFGEDWIGLHPLRENSTHTARLVSVARRLADQRRGITIPRVDLVHGDFNFANLIVRDGGAVAVLDMEQAGRGTRAYDLATLLMVAGWPGDELPPGLQRRIRSAGESVAGPDVLAMCLAAVVTDWTRFGLSHWPTGDVDRFAAHWIVRLESLRPVTRSVRAY